ncbi:MAG: tRNA (adenosine(37)-N6)-threonylcarbamoyltransferase complex ATPase subunit type 1 TsaE [Chloroflexia bacterium]|nr:tRNA (adenosine(37)-N6)-threonylcarbamoyltransferase complex ATPase subunit type 1 TsaE [Chloroflexia bacterium]
MMQVGAALGRQLQRGDVVLLHGDLGAGKTTLAQGIAAALDVAGPVQSPTFTLAAEYDARLPDSTPVRLYHLDLYRLTDPAELESIGYEEYITPPDGVTVIEWPERAGHWLPETYLLITIAHDGAARRLSLSAVGVDAIVQERLQGIIAALRGESPHPPAPSPNSGRGGGRERGGVPAPG